MRTRERGGEAREYRNRSKGRLKKASLNKPWNELRRMDFIFLLQFFPVLQKWVMVWILLLLLSCPCITTFCSSRQKNGLDFSFSLAPSFSLAVAHSPIKRLLCTPILFYNSSHWSHIVVPKLHVHTNKWVTVMKQAESYSFNVYPRWSSQLNFCSFLSGM